MPAAARQRATVQTVSARKGHPAMPKTISAANAPVDEGSQNAATATTSNSETTTGDTEDTQKQAAGSPDLC